MATDKKDLAEARATIKNIVEQLLEDLITPDEASKRLIDSSTKWSKATSRDRLVRDSWECIMHFSADCDIRERDKQYAADQMRGLKQTLDALRRAVLEGKQA